MGGACSSKYSCFPTLCNKEGIVSSRPYANDDTYEGGPKQRIYNIKSKSYQKRGGVYGTIL